MDEAGQDTPRRDQEGESPLSWSQRLSHVLREMHPGNLDTQLPQLLNVTQEILGNQVDYIFSRIPKWLIPESVVNRDELNQSAHEFIDRSRQAIEDNLIFKTLSEVPPKARAAARKVVSLVNEHPLAQRAVNTARSHIQIVDGVACIIEGTAGLTTTNQELDGRQSTLTIGYGSLELFEQLPDEVPVPGTEKRVSLKDLKARSLQIRRMIHHQLPHRQVVMAPGAGQARPAGEPEMPPQSGPIPAPTPA